MSPTHDVGWLVAAIVTATFAFAFACGGESSSSPPPRPAEPASTAGPTSTSDQAPVESEPPPRPQTNCALDTLDGGLAALVPPAPDDAGSALPPFSNADEVVASLRPHFRRCYQEGLNLDPDLAGKVVVTARVADDGSVAKAAVYACVGLTQPVARCIADVVGAAHFSRSPGGRGSSILNIPVTFIQQPKKKPQKR